MTNNKLQPTTTAHSEILKELTSFAVDKKASISVLKKTETTSFVKAEGEIQQRREVCCFLFEVRVVLEGNL